MHKCNTCLDNGFVEQFIPGTEVVTEVTCPGCRGFAAKSPKSKAQSPKSTNSQSSIVNTQAGKRIGSPYWQAVDALNQLADSWRGTPKYYQVKALLQRLWEIEP